MNDKSDERLLGFKEVVHATGESRGNIYFKMRRGRFPEGVKQGGLLYWRAEDIDEYRASPSSWRLKQVIGRMQRHLAQSSVEPADGH